MAIRGKLPGVPDVIDSPADAEAQAAVWMIGLGFGDAMPTRLSGDGGIDVASSRAVAQVKFQVAPVGRPALQNLVGAGAEHPGKLRLFFAWKGYSGPAFVYAEQTNIALFSFTTSGEVVAENTLAEHLCSVAQQSMTGDAIGTLPLEPTAPAQSYSLGQLQPAPPSGGLASWFTWQRVVRLAAVAVVLAAVSFLVLNPDVLVNLVAYAATTAVTAALIWYGAKLTFAPATRRGRSGSRRRR